MAKLEAGPKGAADLLGGFHTLAQMEQQRDPTLNDLPMFRFEMQTFFLPQSAGQR